MYKIDRAVHRIVTAEFLSKRVGSGKYGRSVWIRYCDYMLAQGYHVELYEAQETVSKYITVHAGGDLSFKVRFSDHPPSRLRMLESDVKMCVGYSTDGNRYTLDDAIAACLRWFNIDGYPYEGIREEDRSASSKLGKEKQNKNEEEGIWGDPRQMVLFTERTLTDNRI